MSKVSKEQNRRQSRTLNKRITLILTLGTIIAGAILTPFIDRLDLQSLTSATPKTIAINGSDQWNNDETVTTPTSTFLFLTSQQIDSSPLFNQYTQNLQAKQSLGNAVTVAFPTNQGWIQFFEAGALLFPTQEQKQNNTAQDTLTKLVQSGTKNLATGIIRLPLLQALLTTGSQIPIGGKGSRMTYVDLRKATSPSLMLPAPPGQKLTTTPLNKQGVFILGGKRAGKEVGHFIAPTFWKYINRPDVSPDGWTKDFGTPITEALPFTATIDGHIHHLRIQAFLRDGLFLDQDALDASGQPIVQRLPTGVDYLRTVGPPNVAISPQQTIWAHGETDLFKTADSEQAIAHIGQNFPLTLLGDTSWTRGMLWYHVQWSTPKSIASGWVSAANVTFTSPGNTAAWASFNILSPDLANYLTGIGSNVGVVLYDVTHQRYYTYNSTTQFIVASSMKVPIMLTFLDMVEQQGREPNDDEMNILTTMIENSNNDSASALYFSEIGSVAGVTGYMQKIGMTGLNPDPDSWGYSLITPQAMVDLFTLLYQGKILTAPDRALAFNLMEHVESDQQVGIGDTAPNGFTVAMKDGWVTGPDDLWAMNTSGIVMSDQQTYILSVYTQGLQSLDDGQAIARQVCRTVASLLTE